MVAAPTVAIDLPLKIVASEDAGGTWVAYNDADYLQARHGFPAEFVKSIAALGAPAAAAVGDC